MQRYTLIEEIIVDTKKEGKVRLGEFRLLDGYYNLTKLAKVIKGFNRHNFNRRHIVKECRKVQSNGLEMEFEKDRIYIVESGQGGVTKVHPILMLTIIREISLDLYWEFEAKLLASLT